MSTPGKVNVIDVVKIKGNKLKFSEKLAAVISNGSGTFHTQVIQIFLLFFYTDIMKISTAYVAGLFLVTRIIGAFLAPAFGIMVDKISTPWGKYKPWVIMIGLGIGVFGWLTFTNVDLSGNGKIVYATITYCLYSIFTAIGQGPGAALGPAMTKRLDDRMSMSQIGYFLIIIGSILASVAVLPLYKVLGGGNDGKGFSMVMGIFAVLSVLIAVFQFISIKERYTVKPPKNEKGPSLKVMIVAVFTNKTAIIVYLYVLGMNLSNGIRSGASIYYFKYYFDNESLLSIVGLVSLLPTMIGVAFSTKFTKFVGIKKNLFLSAVVSIVGTAAVIVIPPSSIGVIFYIIVHSLIAFFAGLSTPAQGTMMPAAMDYTEWKSKINVNAFMGSFQGFLQTFATAIAGTITAGMLAIFGYVAGAEQSDETILGLKILMSIVPAAVTILTLSVVWFDLTEDKQFQISKELEERRKNPQGEVLST